MIILSYNIRGLGKKEKRRDVKDLIRHTRAEMCCLQESKLEIVQQRTIISIWGRAKCDWDFVKSDGNSGDLISIWDTSVFSKMSSWGCNEFLVVHGFLVKDGTDCTIVNVYAPNIPAQRYALWDQLGIISSQRHDECLCIVGDFNAIRLERERCGRGVTWNGTVMVNFDNFIRGGGVILLI